MLMIDDDTRNSLEYDNVLIFFTLSLEVSLFTCVDSGTFHPK